MLWASPCNPDGMMYRDEREGKKEMYIHLSYTSQKFIEH